jgi:hypothetical protein
MNTTSLSALLSCSDLHSLNVLNEVLRKRRIHGHVCESDPIEALERRKVDLLVLDLDQDNNEWFRDFSHVDTYSNGIVVIAISQSPQTLQAKGGKHVQCTLLKPLCVATTAKAIDDACTILERERRPACRFEVNFPVTAALMGKNSERTLRRVVLKNISYTGACLNSVQILPIGELISVHFDIPETGRPFQAIGSVVWSDSQGQLGIQFQYVSPEHISALREWLKIKMGNVNVGSHAPQTLPIASPVAAWEL